MNQFFNFLNESEPTFLNVFFFILFIINILAFLFMFSKGIFNDFWSTEENGKRVTYVAHIVLILLVFPAFLIHLIFRIGIWVARLKIYTQK